MVTVTDFYADWCGPCQAMKPILEKVAEQFKDKITLKKVNVDENHEASSKHGVSSIPTLLAEKDDKEISRKIGLQSEKDLTAWFTTLANA